MSAKTLITYSLVSSWQWALNEKSGDKGYQDFLRTLRKEQGEYTDAIMKGIVFEDAVNHIVLGYESTQISGKELECAEKIADIVRGGVSQFSASKDITVDGHTFVLYGKLDYLKAGVIHDIKRTGKYETGKYFSSWQKNAYFYLVSNAHTFQYDVCDGTNIYTEVYRRDEVESVEPTIREFMKWLKANGLWEEYLEKWVSRR